MLDQFLAELKAGGQLDSSGEFSLDASRWQVALRRRPFAEPAEYLLKLIQAGAYAGAEALHIRIDREQTEVRFHGRAPVALEDYLLRLLQTPPESRRAGPTRYLAAALEGVAALDPTSIEWCSWDGRQGKRLLFETQQWRTEGLTRRPWRARQHGFCLRIRGGSRRSQQELELFPERVGYLSMPIWVNRSRPRLRRWTEESPPERAEAGVFPAGFRLSEYYLAAGVNPQLFLPSPGSRRSGIRAEQVRAFWYPRPDNVLLHACEVPIAGSPHPYPARGAVAIDAGLSGPGRLSWVQHGVVVDELVGDFGCPGVMLVADASEMRTDLSGFRLVHNDRYQREVDGLKVTVSSMLRRLRRELRRLHGLPWDRGLTGRASGLTLVSGGLATWMFGPLAGLALGATHWLHTHTRAQEARQKSWETQIQELLARLPDPESE